MVTSEVLGDVRGAQLNVSKLGRTSFYCDLSRCDDDERQRCRRVSDLGAQIVGAMQTQPLGSSLPPSNSRFADGQT